MYRNGTYCTAEYTLYKLTPNLPESKTDFIQRDDRNTTSFYYAWLNKLVCINGVYEMSVQSAEGIKGNIF